MRQLTFVRAFIALVGKGLSGAGFSRRRAMVSLAVATVVAVVGTVAVTRLSAIAQTPPPAGNGTLPGMRFLDAEQLTPAAAKSSYYTPAGSTVTYAWGTTKPIEITATAAALENDPQKIFAFVRNNIRYEPRMGAQKGAIGALIDRSGTAFDQAQLLVELLRAAGYTANYQVGTLTLNATQFNDWLGITNVTAARQFLANGGIPASISATGSLVNQVQMNHAWVQVTISGTTYLLDPSYKAMDRWAQIDIATDANFSASSFVSTAASSTGSGTENGVSYITGVNLSGAETQLNSAANTLLGKIRTTYKDKRSEEIMGGERIRRLDDPWTARTTGSLSATLGTFTGGLPDKFRTKLRAESGNCRVDLFVDEIYGRRLTFNSKKYEEVNDGNGSTPAISGQYGFSIDDKPMPGSVSGQSSDCVFTPAVLNSVRLTIDLPYPQRAAGSSTYGSWMDRVSTKAIDDGANVAIVHGWGDTGSELQARLADSFKQSMPWVVEGSGPPGPASSEYGGPPMRGSGYGPDVSKEKLYAAWLAQMTRATDILEGVSNTRIHHHYTMGVVYTQLQRKVYDQNANMIDDGNEFVISYVTQDSATRIDIDSGYSTTSLAASTTDKTATRHTIASLGAMFEGSLFEQQQDAVDTTSTAQRFPWGQENLGSTIRYHRLLPSGGAVQEYRAGSISSRGATCKGQATANNNYTVIQANDRYLGPGTTEAWHASDYQGMDPYETRAPQSDDHMQRGCAFVAFNSDASEIAHVVTSVDRELKGGGGPSGKDLADRSAPMQGDLLKDTFKDRSNLEGVDLRTGAYTYRPAADLAVGQGDFPYSLSFQRVFQAGGSTCPKCTTGWTHNLDIRATTSGGGLEGMGQTTPQALAAPMVAIKAAFELYKNDPQASANQVSALGVMRWLASKLTNNVVTVNQGASSEAFVRVADGTLVAPPGSQSMLTQTGSRRKLQQGFYGRAPIWYYDQVSFVRRSGDGDEIAFGWREWNPTEIPDQKNSFGSLNGNAQGFFANTWTFPQGVTLTFTYCDDDAPPYVEGTISYYSGRRPCADRLERVSNNLGLWIDVDRLNASSSDGRSTAVTTALGSQVTYNEYFTPVTYSPERVTGFTDAAGKVWTYEWEQPPLTGRASAAPRLKRVREPVKTVAQFELTYDALGRVRTWRDGDSLAEGSGGPIYTYYAPNFGTGAREDPLDGVVRIDYDTDDRAIAQTDEMGRVTRTEYDGLGRVSARVAPFGDRTEFVYDDRNNVLQKWHKPSPSVCPPGFVDKWWCQTTVIKAVYHATWNKPIQVVLPKTADDDQERTYDYSYNSQGLVTQVEEPPVFNGVTGTQNVRPVWALTYDSFGRPLTMTEPTGRKVTTTYGGTNPVFCRTSQIVASQAGGLNLTSTFVCDNRGDVTSVTDPRGNISTTSYDVLRRKLETLGPAGTNIRGQWVYDPAGRVLEEKAWDATAGLWRTTYSGYSTAGRKLYIIDPSGDRTRTCYDEAGRETTKIDGEGRATVTKLNAAGDVLKIFRWRLGDQFGSSVRCGVTIAPDAPTPSTDPELNFWRVYTYDAAGMMTSEGDAKSNLTTFSYDGLGRKIVTTFPDPDGAGPLVAPTEATLMNEREQLVYTRHRSNAGDVRWSKVFTDPAGRTTHLWEYTAAEVLTSETQTALWPRGRVARTSYDLGGRVVYKDVSQQTTSGGFAFDTIDESLVRDRRAYAYDPAGRVTQDQIAPEYGTNPTFTLQYSYAYDAAGNRTSIQWPDAWTATYTFDAANRMASVTFTGGSGTWAYDSQSRPTSFTRSNGTTTSYSYETDSDLATVTHSYVSGSPTTATFAYTRDRAGLITYRGNPVAYDWTPSMAYARSYGPANPLNQVSSEAGVSLAFDVRGNMTSDGTWTFAFDQRNRMISATKPGTTATYDYDGDDRRTKKTVKGVVTRVLWSGDAELAEADASGAILRRYVPGAAVDTPQAMIAAGGTVTWLHADGQGSIVNTSTSAGAAGTPITYSPYGEIGGSGALPAGLPFGYTGRYYDAETGLWYYRARYYHPRLGQFLQTDPIGTKDDPNLYGYVGDDPVNKLDPFGLAGCGSSLSKTECTTLMAAQATALARLQGTQRDMAAYSRNPNSEGGQRFARGVTAAFGAGALNDRAFMAKLGGAMRALEVILADKGGTYNFTRGGEDPERAATINRGNIQMNGSAFRDGPSRQIINVLHEPLHLVSGLGQDQRVWDGSRLGAAVRGVTMASNLAKWDPEAARDNAENYALFIGGAFR